MRNILILIKKEFRQIFRNRGMLPLIFVMPVIQLLILSNAATFEIKNIKLLILDKDFSTSSRLLYRSFDASGYFKIVADIRSHDEGMELIEKNKADILIEIPHGFEKDIFRERSGDLGITINSIDGSKAGIIMNYAQNVAQLFVKQIADKYFLNADISLSRMQSKNIGIVESNWFNTELKYTIFMVPGLLVLLVTMVGTFLSGMNIVREKEIGTLEQINVTPIKKYQFIIGKLLPFWLLALFELSFGLVIAKLVFQVPMIGNLLVIYLFAGIYLFVMLGFGFFISTLTDTQMQSMFLSWFFLVIFILLSGLFTPIENMPNWAKMITYGNPIRYFIEVMRMVLLKGSGIKDIAPHIFTVLGMAIFINSLAVLRYRKSV